MKANNGMEFGDLCVKRNGTSGFVFQRPKFARLELVFYTCIRNFTKRWIEKDWFR
ncbi:hypothetical protein PspKH34_14700 [Parageobacillus sp. KH3-4]|nr:hypothetical protein PspKH34_14700 [Parageobacillus sp. KH3-4]